jgi:rhodanese-related sulfurtransferase
MKSLTVTEYAARREQSPAPVLLDVREGWELETASIEGALHIPMGQIAQRAGGLDRGAEMVVLCHHGARSAQVVQFLGRLGFENVYNLTGGIDAWSLEVDPDVPRY